MGHLATRQCNRTLLADEHTEFADEHVFLTGESEPTGNRDNESEGEESDEDSNNSEGDDSACYGRCILLPLIFYFERHVTVGYFT